VKKAYLAGNLHDLIELNSSTFACRIIELHRGEFSMDIRSRDISSLVFQRKAMKDIGNISIDSRSLAVLVEINGKQNMVSIAQKTGLNMAQLREVISSLLKQNLIEASTNGVKLLNKSFLEMLEAELAIAVGPIAEVLVEDAMADLGYSDGRIPYSNAPELIELVSRDIQREEKKADFIKNMIDIFKSVDH
jgi:hypothetical protein